MAKLVVVPVFLILLHLLSHSSMFIIPSTAHVHPRNLYTCVPHGMCVWSCPPKSFPYKYGIEIPNKSITNATKLTHMDKQGAVDAQKIRSDFLKVLRSRRSAEVPLTVEPAKPVANPLFQEASPPRHSEAMESCPRVKIENFKELLKEENFYLHTEAWDLIKLADYLTQREDIDPTRIGITGESLGGMHAWFGAAADTRYAVVVPIIGVQGFRWAIDNNQWQARVDSIKAVFEEARIDLGKSAIDKEVVEKVWDRIAPGLASQFDSPYTIPAIAPRPLLIVNGAEDPRCPLPGLEVPKDKACKAYGEVNCINKFKLIAQPGIGHQMTPLMVKEASDWFDKFLKN